MDVQMMIIGLVILALFVVPYVLVKFFSAKKKLQINNTIKALLAESGMAEEERVEIRDWVLFLDSKQCKLAVIDRQNLEAKGKVIDLTQIKSCITKSDADNGNLTQFDLVLSNKNGATPDVRFTFYKFGIDRLFDARMLQGRAETLQAHIRNCMTN